ncbi:type VII secretion integral membrane protein EccD [Streptomyces sp. NPDC054841]
MSSPPVDTCRLTVQAPSGWIELSVPADIPLAELLPVLLQQSDDKLAEAGLDHDGWILQRLGEPPLDEDRTPSTLGLVDGETLYLRPRGAALGQLEFDDMVDGVSAGVRGRADRWEGRWTRLLYLALSAAVAACGLLVLLLGGPSLPRASTALGGAALLLLTATALSRAIGDVPAAMLTALLALPYAALGGALFVGGFGAPALLAAAAAAGAAGLLGHAGVSGFSSVKGQDISAADSAPVFAGVLALTVGPVIGGLLTAGLEVSAMRSAGIVMFIALSYGPSIPMGAFRLARLKLPPLPTSAEELQLDLDPLPGQRLMQQAAAADRYMLALFAAVGTVAGVSASVLATSPGWPAPTVAALAAVTLLLRSRVVEGVGHRLCTVAPAVLITGALLVRIADAPSERLWLSAVLLLLVLLLLVCARTLPGRRLLPYWGRAADLLETAASVALPLLLLQVLGVYAYARALNG